MKHYKPLLKETKDIPEIKIGDIIVFNPNAELTLSYKEGVVPSKWVKQGVWFSDTKIEAGADDEEPINVNCGNHPSGAGYYCSYGTVGDIDEIVRVSGKNRKQKSIWKKKENI
jgi:hypothetical protein